MKYSFLVISLTLYSINIYAQVIPNSQLSKVVLTVEAFLNDETTLCNEYKIISVHEWNERSHSGYTNVHRDFYILSYPYIEIFNLNEITENKIIISLSPNKDAIIINVVYQDVYYQFYSKINIFENRRYLENIPNELYAGP